MSGAARLNHRPQQQTPLWRGGFAQRGKRFAGAIFIKRRVRQELIKLNPISYPMCSTRKETRLTLKLDLDDWRNRLGSFARCSSDLAFFNLPSLALTLRSFRNYPFVHLRRPPNQSY